MESKQEAVNKAWLKSFQGQWQDSDGAVALSCKNNQS